MLNEGTSQPVQSQAIAVPRSLPMWFSALVIGAVALVPRVWGLGDFFTIDEPYHWVGRVQRFAIALLDHRWEDTNQTGHPGVTTMWLGTLGQWIGHQFDIYYFGWTGGGTDYLAVMRLPVAIVNSLAVVVGFLLLCRLFRAETALLAALLWATSPFLIAHSRLLHLDALVTSFMTLSLLLLLDATTDYRPLTTDHISIPSSIVNSPWSFIGSGVCAGLALLTKAPSLILLPFVGLLMLLATLSCRTPLWKLVVAYAAWLGIAALVVMLLWPAMWVAPVAAISAVYKEVTQNGGEPQPSGNYFLGQAVAVPGPLFYPAVILWRTTPITLLGLLVLAVFALRTMRSMLQALWKRRALTSPLVALTLFVLIFTLLMSVEPKQFDRYLLPIWPSLEILAAVGWNKLLDELRRRLTTDNRRPMIVRPAALGSWFLVLVAVFSFSTLLAFQPYYLAYFNPLMGGSSTGERVMLVGWGEGLEQVGTWISQRPDAGVAPVLSWIPPVLAPFVPKSVLVLDLREQYLTQRSSYAVLYIRSVQHKESPVAEAAVRKTPALFTVRMHGIEYASVHQLPRPFATARDSVFGDGLHLRGFTAAQVGNTLVMTPSWDIQSDQPAHINMFVHVLDAQGQRVAQSDDSIDRGMFPTWQAGQQFDNALQLPDLPAGDYRLVLGVYNAASGARLPIRTGEPLPGAVDGPDALLLATWKQR